MKRERILGLLAVLAVGGLYLSPALSFDRVRIGSSSSGVSPNNGAIYAAELKGLFKKHGIEVEVIEIGGGAARGVSALVAGDIQFLAGGGAAAISAALKGADLVLVASVLNKGIQRVMARPDVKSPADLKGKKVGISRFGSASHTVLQLMLRRWNINPSEIQVIQVGSSPAMLASLDKGWIDAAVLTAPVIFVAEDKGYRVLADLADLDIDYLHEAMIAKQSYLHSHRDQATRFIKGYIEGIAYFKRHKNESMEVLRKKLRMEPGRDDKYLARMYDLYASKYFDKVPYPSLRGAETVLEFLAKEDPKTKSVEAKSFLDSSIVRELEASGFINSLYEN
ncbi:MAG: ABC transporter substrate-binding protein [Alphaproteobacteria bacterium]